MREREPSSRLADVLEMRLSEGGAVKRVGRLAQAYGTLLRASGLRAAIGELCELRDAGGDYRLHAEVVGIAGEHTLLTPLGSLQGLSAEVEVHRTGEIAHVVAGDSLLGRVVDAHGAPIDDGGPILGGHRVPLYAASPNPMRRRPVARPLATGVRAVDALLTLGEGQRVGIFAAAGGGKSTLLSMIARGTEADVNVVVLVGERGREVGEFVHQHLGSALVRSVVVVATSDRPPLERARAAYLGTAVAEFFRDEGQRVLLLMDSVTRFARALRDVGLAVGEPPARRGFPPSVFTALPQLFERAGNNSRGSITAAYTVLMEDEETSDPIAEETRSLLDGHVILSRRLAAANHYPAIDVLASTSRTMSSVVEKHRLEAAGKLRECLAKYREIELLIQIGEYEPGKDAAADMAVDKQPAITDFLRQSADEACDAATAMQQMEEMFA